MFKSLLLLTTCVAAVVGRSSPNAGMVKRRFHSRRGSSYPKDVLEDAVLDVPGLITKYGYPVEVHTVKTADGYLLEVHRIPHGRDNNNNTAQRPGVLIMHGLLSSSAEFVIMGPRKGFSYQLAEAGYDVWLGNARGNYYSRNHLKLSPEKNDFWRFSWDEIGNFDLPAIIDYILTITGEKKIHFIGYSQGGTSFLVLNSLRPQYNDRFISFQGLAPGTFFTYAENLLIRTLALFSSVSEIASFTLGMAEIFSSSNSKNLFLELFCSLSIPAPLDLLCNIEITDIFVSTAYYNTTMLPVIVGHTPAGASVRQFIHYAQVIRYDLFRRYKHVLALSNLFAYGRLDPPEYDLSKVTAPSYLYYCLADQEVHYKDLFKLAKVLPNVVKVNKISRSSFQHLDFIWGIDATEQVYVDIVAAMKDAESKFL